MNVILTVSIIICLIGLAQSVLMIILLSFYYSKRKENRLLIAILIFLSFTFIELIFNSYFEASQVINFLFINHLNGLVLGPLMLIYALEISKVQAVTAKKKMLLFSPKVLCMSYFILVYHIQDFDTKVKFIDLGTTNWILTSIILFTLCYTITCLILAMIILLNKWRNSTKKALRKSHLQILVPMICIYFLICLFSMFELFMIKFTGNQSFHNFTIYQAICFYLFSCFLVIYILRFPTKISIHKLPYDKMESDQLLAEVAKSIEKVLLTEKLFLRDEFNIEELARRVGKPTKLVSKSLNEYLKTSYSDFIHIYRINHFLELVQKGEHKNKVLLSLAFDSGFKSKTVFNRTFKKKMGITPTEYINQQD